MVVGLGLYTTTVLTCGHLARNSQFFGEYNRKKTFDRRNYSNRYLIKAESRTKRGSHCGRGSQLAHAIRYPWLYHFLWENTLEL
ncbi:hypothetical protein TNCV_3420181 [Trichonephila clavipes]|nr:hypothetical protein TNCV_3420181 [Trichonephila clavipes]